MNTSLATFMKVMLTVVVISSLIFFTAIKMLDDESDKYKLKIEELENEVLTT